MGGGFECCNGWVLYLGWGGERERVVTCDFNFDRVKTAGKTHGVMQPSFSTVVQQYSVGRCGYVRVSTI